jgi:hypothetical protein
VSIFSHKNNMRPVAKKETTYALNKVRPSPTIETIIISMIFSPFSARENPHENPEIDFYFFYLLVVFTLFIDIQIEQIDFSLEVSAVPLPTPIRGSRNGRAAQNVTCYAVGTCLYNSFMEGSSAKNPSNVLCISVFL